MYKGYNMYDYSSKGSFVKTNKALNFNVMNKLKSLDDIMNTIGKNDGDSFINEVRDSIVGSILGFNYVNTNKHGFDCKNEQNQFLESKVTSYASNAWTATFNDTTYEKCDFFERDDVYLALSVWNNFSDCVCIVYGKNKEIGSFLRSGVDRFKEGKCVRSTQTISMSALINKYGFKLYAVNRNKDDMKNLLSLKHKNMKNVSDDIIEEIYYSYE